MTPHGAFVLWFQTIFADFHQHRIVLLAMCVQGQFHKFHHEPGKMRLSFRIEQLDILKNA